MDVPSWLEERPLDAGAAKNDLLDMAAPSEWLASALLRSWCDEPTHTNSLSVSIEAPWGAGKTSFVHLVQKHLSNALSHQGEPIWVELSAWQSGSLAIGAWPAIAYRIGEALYGKLHRAAIASRKAGEPTIRVGRPRDPSQMVELDVAPLADERFHWLQVALVLSQVVKGDDWHPCLKLFADAPSKVPGHGTGWGQGSVEIVRGAIDIGGTVAGGVLAGPGAAVTLLAAAGKAVDASGKAVSAFTKKTLLEGPPWGVDTTEFVQHLNRLCAVLLPHVKKWRVAVLIDDVARVGPTELRSVLDALSYLREMQRVIVLVCLDDAAIERLETQLPDHLRGRGEKFISKVIHTRYKLANPDPGLLGRFADRLLADMGLPSAFEAASAENPTRRLLSGGVRTPREIKRALTWIWSRLSSDESALRRCRQRSNGEILSLLVDLYLFFEGLLSAEDLDARIRPRRAVLLRFERQPWDGQIWLDRRRAIEDSTPEANLVAWLRTLRLAQFAGLELNGRRVEEAQSVWGAWCADLSAGGSDPLKLSKLNRRLSDLPTYLRPDAIEHGPLPLLCAVSSAARTLWLGAHDAPPRSLQEVLDRWHDADALVQTILSPQAAPMMIAAASMLLHVFHRPVVKAIDQQGTILQSALSRAIGPDAAQHVGKDLADVVHAVHGEPDDE